MKHPYPLSYVQEFARNAHETLVDTTVSNVKRPRSVHLQEVADLVWASGGSDEEVVAAWLHDVVEDTSITLENIIELFGKEVADLVEHLTDLDEYLNLSLVERKQKQADRVAKASAGVRRIKIADQTSNVKFLAIDPTTSMTFEECQVYITGAKKIADACSGVSPLLDELFKKAYAMGAKRYNLSEK
jgi:(p)ppGpp synthase/HD superfamily hydrolase